MSTSPAVATTGLLPRDLGATFAVVLAPGDVSYPDEAGFWYLTLTPMHGYAFGRPPASPENTGNLAVGRSEVTFSGERGDGACAGSGMYKWRVSGDSLTFTLVRDACDARVKQTTAQTYYRCSSGPTSCRTSH